MDFGLFYFANDNEDVSDRYRLLIEGAKFADTHDFAAVWTPERHFHAFGGLYPNPAVTGAAVAAVTERVAVRAGSVVAPLHHPVRVAEEWSVVDNLSKGRVGIAFASGWHAADFLLRPEGYATRRSGLIDTVKSIRGLWRREPASYVDGAGESVEVTVFPPPVQSELPVWLTSAGNPQTFREAGEMGAGVLTHLLGQGVDVLEKRIAEYRQSFRDHHDESEGDGHVALMLHTFIGSDREAVRETVRAPFSKYLASSFDLVIHAAKAAGENAVALDLNTMTQSDIDFMVGQAFDRYFQTSGMFGTVEDALQVCERLYAIGVDEIACLIDFGVDTDDVLNSLVHLDELRQAWQEREQGR
ncbi:MULTISPECIES: MupA/Atu3671 family FMN-dependent luciferase-like monooxygenase [Streptomyces]|uniref:LLM class flavin-dependent oxidoreductase n=2 Tax=Streptomyces anulatus TaxID=1892 RepID=A0A7K3RB89_STRAQ|nr:MULTISPECIES: MupA/Atu3671 family FMN-dependent luciferase-like monooxygenase [Streptomyces]NDZ58375.1 LLM class flavin-dependent oxidoreductase [Streptomyces anulatus]NEB99325.1 LLM class flavin-dependent oxidoreductase [Streptomyces anulatus]NED24920.1 LLM class flavin-dependent oxidoreductase [Streptomyces anulatus]OLO31987.1 monooxygenase [Streptomyces sp. MNU77]OWA23546.1 LLM class flavin-dependent oxidoreductase [Streptomyces sp. CS057]